MIYWPVSPRIPERCYSHSAYRYVVQPGDTSYLIAQKFGISLDSLSTFNYHISNINYIIPGDVMCIPKIKPYSFLVPPTINAPQNTYANVVATTSGITVYSNLPPIEEIEGNYTNYKAYFVALFDRVSISLKQISEDPSIWFVDIPRRNLIPGDKIYVTASTDFPSGSAIPPESDLILFEIS